MLFRSSIAYFLARAIPILVAGIAVPIYTRILDPAEYGLYAKVMALVMFADAVLFQWTRVSMLRYVDDYPPGERQLLSELYFAGWVPGTIILLVLTMLIWMTTPELAHVALWVLVIVFFYSWHEFALVFFVGRRNPLAFAKLAATKALIALAVGLSLALIGIGGEAMLAGVLVACFAAPLIFARSAWGGIPRPPDGKYFRPLLAYGLPLVPTFLFSWVIQASDRLILAWMEGDAAVGSYAVGYDLAQFAVSPWLVAVNLAAYPLAIQAFNLRGNAAAADQIRLNGELLVMLAVAAAVGLVVLAGPLSEVLVGLAYREAVQRTLPVVGLAAAIAGIKAFHFDIAFHLTRRTGFLVASMLLGAVANALLNILWIPHFGIVGAAWATVVGYAVATCISGIAGRRFAVMPPFGPVFARAFAVAIVVGAGAVLGTLVAPSHPALQLLAGVFGGASLGAVVAYSMNISDVRKLRSENKMHSTRKSEVL